MEPFYLDSEGDKLFGAYHPAGDSFSRKAVLICPPIYAEYFRTYRYLRKLAEVWAQSGFHVLRFDYFGTGDSDGDWDEAGPERWIRDIRIAAEELVEISGSESLTLAGIRFGAPLAFLSAAEIPKVERMVFLDPIVDGRSYISSLEATHERLLDKFDDRTRMTLRKLPSELAGLPRAKWLDSELSAIDINTEDMPGDREIVYIASQPDYVDHDFISQLETSGNQVKWEICNDDCDWGTPSESTMIAASVFEGLKRCI